MAASVANISNVQALLDQARRLKLKRMTVQISSAWPSHGMDRLMGGDGWPHVLRALCKKRMDRLDEDIWNRGGNSSSRWCTVRLGRVLHWIWINGLNGLLAQTSAACSAHFNISDATSIHVLLRGLVFKPQRAQYRSCTSPDSDFDEIWHRGGVWPKTHPQSLISASC